MAKAIKIRGGCVKRRRQLIRGDEVDVIEVKAGRIEIRVADVRDNRTDPGLARLYSAPPAMTRCSLTPTFGSWGLE